MQLFGVIKIFFSYSEVLNKNKVRLTTTRFFSLSVNMVIANSTNLVAYAGMLRKWDTLWRIGVEF